MHTFASKLGSVSLRRWISPSAQACFFPSTHEPVTLCSVPPVTFSFPDELGDSGHYLFIYLLAWNFPSFSFIFYKLAISCMGVISHIDEHSS